MKKILFTFGFLILCANLAHAQTQVTTKQSLVWDQAAPDLATANAYTYKYGLDGAAVTTVYAGVACSGTASPFQCKAAFPSTTAGGHSIVISAGNIAGDSLPSSPLPFSFAVIPGTPQNLRIGG